jgi:hypothetical protein
MANQGYGIAGARNVYSHKALLENWVEDSYGVSLKNAGSRPGVLPGHYTTNTMATHGDPKEMKPHPNIGKAVLESVDNMKRKIKDGMPYELLFCPGNDGSYDRFQTTLQSVQTTSAGAKMTLHDGVRRTERLKGLRREQMSSEIKQSEQSSASLRLKGTELGLDKRDYMHVPLPVWSRKAMVSKFPPT